MAIKKAAYAAFFIRDTNLLSLYAQSLYRG